MPNLITGYIRNGISYTTDYPKELMFYTLQFFQSQSICVLFLPMVPRILKHAFKNVLYDAVVNNCIVKNILESVFHALCFAFSETFFFHANDDWLLRWKPIVTFLRLIPALTLKVSDQIRGKKGQHNTLLSKRHFLLLCFPSQVFQCLAIGYNFFH